MRLPEAISSAVEILVLSFMPGALKRLRYIGAQPTSLGVRRAANFAWGYAYLLLVACPTRLLDYRACMYVIVLLQSHLVSSLQTWLQVTHVSHNRLLSFSNFINLSQEARSSSAPPLIWQEVGMECVVIANAFMHLTGGCLVNSGALKLAPTSLLTKGRAVIRWNEHTTRSCSQSFLPSYCIIDCMH